MKNFSRSLFGGAFVLAALAGLVSGSQTSATQIHDEQHAAIRATFGLPAGRQKTPHNLNPRRLKANHGSDKRRPSGEGMANGTAKMGGSKMGKGKGDDSKTEVFEIAGKKKQNMEESSKTKQRVGKGGRSKASGSSKASSKTMGKVSGLLTA
jgi:hypothetical protein